VMMLKHVFIAGIVGAAAATFGLAQAQTGAGHDHHAQVRVAAKSTMEMSEGEVRKIDLQNKRITLKHGPLKNLDMPAMTMAFQASDLAMLSKVKVGDQVRFVAANPGGMLTVTEIQVTPK
jgi:Cu(I)/Ag(I) efflux system periplasmic protein CusF